VYAANGCAAAVDTPAEAQAALPRCSILDGQLMPPTAASVELSHGHGECCHMALLERVLKHACCFHCTAAPLMQPLLLLLFSCINSLGRPNRQSGQYYARLQMK
jgi:hypothetical protein